MGLQKSYNQFILTNKLKTDYPLNLKLAFLTNIFPIMQKKKIFCYRRLNVI